MTTSSASLCSIKVIVCDVSALNILKRGPTSSALIVSRIFNSTEFFDISDRILLVMKNFITLVNKSNKSENHSKISLDRSDVTPKI